MTDFAELGAAIGRVTNEKNKAYGNSFAKCGEFLKLLYPDGVKTGQYLDMLAVVRVYDKLMRIATHKDALGEDPWRDVAGYALLGVASQTVTPDKYMERQALCCCSTSSGGNTYYCPHHGRVQRG